MTTTEQPGIWLLLRAAGCRPVSFGGHADGSTWGQAFISHAGERVDLKGTAQSWQQATGYARRAVEDWLRANGRMPSPEAITNAMLAEAVAASTQQAEDTAKTLAMLVRAAQADAARRFDGNAIRVWCFYDAPEILRALSEHGGDEDWLALCPPGSDQSPPWAEEGGAFGCCDVRRHELDDGSVVLIGAHA